MSTKLCEQFSNITILSENKILVPGTIFKLYNDTTIYQFIGYNMYNNILYQLYNNNNITLELYHGKQSNINQILYEPSYYKQKKLF